MKTTKKRRSTKNPEQVTGAEAAKELLSRRGKEGFGRPKRSLAHFSEDELQQIAAGWSEYKPRKSYDMAPTGAGAGKDVASAVSAAEFAAVRVIGSAEGSVGVGAQLDVPALASVLREQAAAVHGGDMRQAEAMLINQASALQSLFSKLSERAMGCQTAPGFEVNMRMALRAQAQCRTTLETLSTIKNPPVVFAKQANISNGNQQVNNGPVQNNVQVTRGTNESEPNKLLEAPSEEPQWLDGRATEEAISSGPSLEAVAAVDGSTDSGR